MEVLPTLQKKNDNYLKWTVDEVAQWVDDTCEFLESNTFAKQDVNGVVLSRLTDADMLELFPKITVGQRIVFLKTVDELATARNRRRSCIQPNRRPGLRKF